MLPFALKITVRTQRYANIRTEILLRGVFVRKDNKKCFFFIFKSLSLVFFEPFFRDPEFRSENFEDLTRFTFAVIDVCSYIEIHARAKLRVYPTINTYADHTYIYIYIYI